MTWDFTAIIGLWLALGVAFALGFMIASRLAVRAYQSAMIQNRAAWREREREFAASWATANSDPDFDAFSTSEEGVNKNAGEFSHLADDIAFASSVKTH